MEEKIGKRINIERVEEAIATGAQDDRRRLPVLLDDDRRRGDLEEVIGAAAEEVEVVDVATVLLRSVRPGA